MYKAKIIDYGGDRDLVEKLNRLFSEGWEYVDYFKSDTRTAYEGIVILKKSGQET